MSKSKGELLSDALVASGFTVVPWCERGNRERGQLESTAEEYEKNYAHKLPATDLLKFVEEVEKSKPIARLEVWSPDGPFEVVVNLGSTADCKPIHVFKVKEWAQNAVDRINAATSDRATTLCRIVREKLVLLRQAELFEQAVIASNRFIGDTNAKLNEENDELREKIAGLEAAIKVKS